MEVVDNLHSRDKLVDFQKTTILAGNQNQVY